MSETAEAADGQMAPEQTYSEYPAPDYPEQDYGQPEAPRSFVQRFRANKILLFGTIGIVVILLVAAAMLAGGGGGILGSSTPPPAAPKLVAMTGDIPKQDEPQVATGQTYDMALVFGDENSTVSNIYEVTVACSWTDDYAGSDPDTMKFELVSPDGQNVSQTSSGTSGNAQLTIKTNATDKKVEDNTQGWVLHATCVEAGGKPVGPFGFLIYVDAGNNFSATVTYKYYGYEDKTNSTM